MNHGNVFKMQKVVAFRIYVKNDLWLERFISPFGRRNHVTRSEKMCQMLDTINQNHFFLEKLSFETIIILAS
jgi:hypothetical protein